MSTRKNSVVVATVCVGWFPFFAVFPLRCMAEVIEGWADILCLFRPGKVWGAVTFLGNIAAAVRNHGPLDLADIDVKSAKANIRARLLLR